MGSDRIGAELHVVGRQPVVLGAHEALEVEPRAPRQAVELAALGVRELARRAVTGEREQVGGERGKEPYDEGDGGDR